jgi:hypothetical protein
MLLTMIKKVNQDQRKQIRALIRVTQREHPY